MTSYKYWAYNHEAVPKAELATDTTRKLLFVLARMLFRGSDGKPEKSLELTIRLRRACSEILGCHVSHVSQLAQSDAKVVIGALEGWAKRDGFWKPGLTPEPEEGLQLSRARALEDWGNRGQS